ncbi:MAG: response regulator [Bacteroidia bacterium]|nr:response regulator [Bacteroidia bacterium]MDW8302185.1 response regulator [Bacteroidia bacterium]
MKKQVILCVDDEKIVLSSLIQELEANFGDRFVYEAAETAEEAKELISEYESKGEYTVTLVICDWLMPHIKGDEFLIELYQVYPHIKTIVLTGQANAEAIEQMQKYANISAYIHKPWQAEKLIQTIEQVLSIIPES